MSSEYQDLDRFEDEWPNEPDRPGPLGAMRLPTDALPRAIRDHVLSVAGHLQVPHELPLMVALGCLSAAVAGRVVVKARIEWREPVGLYTAVISPPATRKSPTYAAMTAPLWEWERESIRRATPRLRLAQDRLEVAERRLGETKAKVAKGTATLDELEHDRNRVEEARANMPPDGRLLASDITPEAMVERLAAQGGRLAILEPEPGPLQLVAGRYSPKAQLNELKKAFDCETLLVDRMSRGHLRVERPALTLSLMMQPGVLDNLPNKDAFRNEGVFARFLWCEPPHGLGTRLTGAQTPPPDLEAKRRYEHCVRRLLDLEPLAVDADGTPIPHVITLDEEALRIFHVWEAEVEAELGPGGRYSTNGEWAGKMVGQTLRVAALLELADRAGSDRPLTGASVGKQAMNGAVALLRALATHALVVLGTALPDPELELLWHVLSRAIEMPRGSTVLDLFERVKGRRQLTTRDKLAPLIADLTERGCLRLRSAPQEGRGRPRSPVIEIHPDLLRRAPESRSKSNGNFTNFTNFTNASDVPEDLEDLPPLMEALP